MYNFNNVKSAYIYTSAGQQRPIFKIGDMASLISFTIIMPVEENTVRVFLLESYAKKEDLIAGRSEMVEKCEITDSEDYFIFSDATAVAFRIETEKAPQENWGYMEVHVAHAEEE